MPRRRITFRQLETFAAVSRLNSFTKAADALHLSQPAVSIQIKQIADTIGLPLFEQSGRDIALSPAGEELLKTVRSLDDIWNHFESAIDELKGLKRGKLRVALVTTAKYFLPRMLGAFCKRYPDIDIELEIANREKIVERLRNNQDDIYVMSYPPENLDIVRLPFLDNEYVVVAPKTHWAVGKQVSIHELANEAFLLRELGSGSRHIIDQHMQTTGTQLKVRLSLASNEAIRDLVASGMGLSVLSRHALGKDFDRDGLVALEVEGFPLKQAWNVVHLSSKILSLPAQAFLDELLKQSLGGV
ncbi:LysR family transcriptional regulator [Quatrionicoccus australiensis]|uniref:LysR family transcriptional regulator n=1 Tax=Quatrionicoccus australiensis TaxID=138118 RepID=UPI001CFC391E|nr:LysR family transcriptional regulator [Quatrionicoccus australiensis]MCB4362091.1 LysR family transcriptional regulator [Quatrionicoccus australiensis]